MKRFFSGEILITGFAVFAMFFGAGNSVFPLEIGRTAGISNFYAISGFLLTAVGMPFIGLASMILFKGDYREFFYRIGKVPGFAALVLIICIIGPFNAMPRCITLSHAAVKAYVPGLSLLLFSILSAAIIFIFSVKENKILDILGYVLSPVLLISLGIIIVKSLFFGSSAVVNYTSSKDLFVGGLMKGYLTMDLLAAVFFSFIVLKILVENLKVDSSKDYKKLAKMTFKVACVAAGLLGITYLGLSYAASFRGLALEGIAQEELLVAIARNLMGDALGIVASVAVALACLTTALTLAAVFTDFIRIELFENRISYITSLLLTLSIMIFYANYGFSRIVGMAAPILNVIYPAVIVLAVVNIAYKLFGFKYVKIPFYFTIALSLIIYLK